MNSSYSVEVAVVNGDALGVVDRHDPRAGVGDASRVVGLALRDGERNSPAE